jgi:Tfp pilus assembly protein PilO
MISFKTKNDSASAIVFIFGVILILGSAAWITLIPLPTEQASSGANRTQNLKKIKEATDKAESEAVASQAAIDAMLWTESAQEVSPKAFAIVNQFALKHHLKVASFRPQKPVDVQGMTEIPFGLSVDGSYPDTMQLVKDLETTDTKLALSLIQINSAEASSDHVNGTINFVAYLKPEVKVPASTPKGGPSAQKPK